MADEQFVCRKCGWEWTAVPGEESPPDCPECESTEVEKFEQSTVGFAVTPPDKKA